MNGRQILELIGKDAVYHERSKSGNVDWWVTITDVNPNNYGKVLYQILPLSGHGTRWVSSECVTLDEAPR